MVGLRKRHLVNALNPAAQFDLSATAVLNAGIHANRNLMLTGDGSTAQTYTLPLATGSGNTYTFYVRTTNSGTYVINAAGSDEFDGSAQSCDGNDATGASYIAATGSNFTVFTFGDTTRGELGTWIQFKDVASAVWLVNALMTVSSNSTATPFT
ncbi:hypothetical protein LCGC14_1456610 [marine sediment metagenome]|uniref:Uncharacterized protein n=1 Tax=marine sediment metagenome TaxID=412755 RepID=A0A0F9JH30_9ZZZZ